MLESSRVISVQRKNPVRLPNILVVIKYFQVDYGGQKHGVMRCEEGSEVSTRDRLESKGKN